VIFYGDTVNVDVRFEHHSSSLKMTLPHIEERYVCGTTRHAPLCWTVYLWSKPLGRMDVVYKRRHAHASRFETLNGSAKGEHDGVLLYVFSKHNVRVVLIYEPFRSTNGSEDTSYDPERHIPNVHDASEIPDAQIAYRITLAVDYKFGVIVRDEIAKGADLSYDLPQS
jgi:hypothetical protein